MIYPVNLSTAITSVARTLSNTASYRSDAVSKIASGSNFESKRADYAAFQVSMKFNSAGIMMDSMKSNMASALSYLGAQEQSLKQIGAQLDRMGELVSQMSDPTKTSADQESFMHEFNQLRSAMASEQFSSFNGLDLYYNQGDASSYNVQLSADGNQNMTLAQADLSQQAGWIALLGFSAPYNGLEGISDTPANLIDPNVLGGASFFAGMSEVVSGLIAQNISQQTQLHVAMDHTEDASHLTKSASASISDIDVAREVTNLNKTDILMKAGGAMFAQANVAAESVLKLYGV